MISETYHKVSYQTSLAGVSQSNDWGGMNALIYSVYSVSNIQDDEVLRPLTLMGVTGAL